jgi:putative PIG3 family NAD(P)H quinone oxidoreductase
MRAITIPRFGGPEVLTLSEVPLPVAGPQDVVIDVVAAGLNHADLAQREGHYPSPPGAPEWPGMELSGVISSVGAGVIGWRPGDRVCALVPGGGYAERAVVDERLLLAVPDDVDLVDAAGIPEAACTVFANVYLAGGLDKGQTLLVHGGSSGIGSMAIQLATALGNPVFATAGSPAKVAFCADLGARGIDYRQDDFATVIERETDGRGVDLILDIVGGDYLPRNVASLALGGAVVIIANQSGKPGTFDIGALMRKRARIIASTLRARPLVERAAIVAAVQHTVMPLVGSGDVRPVIDRRFPLADAADAHRRMETSEHLGKILLTM